MQMRPHVRKVVDPHAESPRHLSEAFSNCAIVPSHRSARSRAARATRSFANAPLDVAIATTSFHHDIREGSDGPFRDCKRFTMRFAFLYDALANEVLRPSSSCYFHWRL